MWIGESYKLYQLWSDLGVELKATRLRARLSHIWNNGILFTNLGLVDSHVSVFVNWESVQLSEYVRALWTLCGHTCLPCTDCRFVSIVRWFVLFICLTFAYILRGKVLEALMEQKKSGRIKGIYGRLVSTLRVKAGVHVTWRLHNKITLGSRGFSLPESWGRIAGGWGRTSPPVPRRPWFWPLLSESEKPLEPRVNSPRPVRDTTEVQTKRHKTVSDFIQCVCVLLGRSRNHRRQVRRCDQHGMRGTRTHRVRHDWYGAGLRHLPQEQRHRLRHVHWARQGESGRKTKRKFFADSPRKPYDTAGSPHAIMEKKMPKKWVETVKSSSRLDTLASSPPLSSISRLRRAWLDTSTHLQQNNMGHPEKTW